MVQLCNMNDNIKLGILSDDSNTNDFIYITAELGARPSRISIIGEFYPEGFMPALADYSPMVINSIQEIIVGEDDVINTRYLSKLSNDIYVNYLVLNEGEEDTEIVTNISFFFTETNMQQVNEIIDNLEAVLPEELEEAEREANVVYSLSIEEGDIRLEPFFDKEIDFTDIEYFYNTDVWKEVQSALRTLEASPKGILSISGPKGVGKTNLLKYMVSKIEFTTRIIYVPVQLFEIFNANDINKFLRNNPDSVFILDDFDMDEYNSERIINSIVHLVDGYKSDIYNCSFIIVNNDSEVLEIDSNNHHDTIVVGSLSEAKAKALCKKLKLKTVDPQSNDLRLISVLKNIEQVTQKIGY